MEQANMYDKQGNITVKALQAEMFQIVDADGHGMVAINLHKGLYRVGSFDDKAQAGLKVVKRHFSDITAARKHFRNELKRLGLTLNNTWEAV